MGRGLGDVFGTRMWYPNRDKNNRPVISTLIRMAYECGIPANLILEVPREAARASGQLVFDEKQIPIKAKPRRPEAIRKQIFKFMHEQMSSHPDTPMLSLKAIAKENGVSQGFIRYALKEFVPRYQKLRHARMCALSRQSLAIAGSTLDNMILEAGEQVLFTEQKGLAKKLSVLTGCSVPVARMAINFIRDPVAKKLENQPTFGVMMAAYYNTKRSGTRQCLAPLTLVTEAFWDTPAFHVTPAQLVDLRYRIDRDLNARLAYRLTYHIYAGYRWWLGQLLSPDQVCRMSDSPATNPGSALKPWIRLYAGRGFGDSRSLDFLRREYKARPERRRKGRHLRARPI